jgi:hypothetical protein
LRRIAAGIEFLGRKGQRLAIGPNFARLDARRQAFVMQTILSREMDIPGSSSLGTMRLKIIEKILGIFISLQVVS